MGGMISPMKSLSELDHLNLDPAAKTQVAAMVQALIEQAQQEALQASAAQLQVKDDALRAQLDLLMIKESVIKQKEIKIQALTHELLYLRRIRYGVKNEALNQVQRDLFEETWNTDLAVVEAELEQLQDSAPQLTVAKPKRPRAGRQPLPDRLPRIEHLHVPESCTCGQCGQDLVKIGDDITEQPDVEPAKFFVHTHSSTICLPTL